MSAARLPPIDDAMLDRLFRLKGRALRAKYRDADTEITVDLEELLTLFSQVHRLTRARRLYRWLYRRQRAHMRKLGIAITEAQRGS